MDTLTHALSGALLARATAGAQASRALPRRIAAGFFACAAPDLDFVTGFAGPVTYLLNHRGVTHSVILLPLWALALSWLLAKIVREPEGKGATAGWRALYGITAMSIGLHIAGDVITSYGTMVFAPLSDWRAGIGTTFVVLVAYVGFQYAQRAHALEFAAQHARPGTKIDAQPRPVSPFNWTVFVSDDEAHEFAHVNLVRAEPRHYQPGDGFIARIDSPYLPLDQAIWVRRSRYGEANAHRGREAWNSEGLAVLRWFAVEPAFDGDSDGGRCVWFVDLRFLTPGREVMPFQFGACRDAPGAPWQAYERATHRDISR